ncbi:MAG: pseudouridine synthase [Crenarchaeota archaeon]|nr:pseudouridine synthase [Thermoproteota archaeon]
MCDLSGVRIKYSRTGKPRYAFLGEERLFTIKPSDMSLSLSPAGARLLDSCLPGKVGRVWTSEEPQKSVFAKHVIEADPSIRRGVDVLVYYSGRLIAFGKALMSGREMNTLNLGEAVRVRGRLE